MGSFFEVARKANGSIDGMACGHGTDFEELDGPDHQSRSIVEVVIDAIALIVVIDAVIFRIHPDGVSDGSSPSLVAVTYHRGQKEPRKHWNLIANIDGEGCVVGILIKSNLSVPAMLGVLIDEVEI